MQPKANPVNSNSKNEINCGKIIEQFQAFQEVRILKAVKQTFLSNGISPAGVKHLVAELYDSICTTGNALLHTCCYKMCKYLNYSTKDLYISWANKISFSKIKF